MPDESEAEFEELVIARLNTDFIRDIVLEVWRRLPAIDRRELSWRVQIEEKPSDLHEFKRLADTSIRNPKDNEPLYLVKLLSEYPTEAVARYVIAHELAHCILRHLVFSCRVYKVKEYEENFAAARDRRGKSNAAAITRDLSYYLDVIEEHADFQVVAWGFGDDLVAKCHECPESPHPVFMKIPPAPQEDDQAQ